MQNDAAFKNFLLLATFLHVIVLAILSLSVKNVPLPPTATSLKLQLGHTDTAYASQSSATTTEKDSQTTPSMLEHPSAEEITQPPKASDAKVKEIKATPKPPQPKKHSAVKQGIQKKNSLRLPMIPTVVYKPARGSFLGNSSDDKAEPLRRYEQLLSAWFEKHKYYPDDALNHNIEGDAVLWIQIDRSGQILRYYLKQNTGSHLLDAAIPVIVQNANPVPRVPANYPADQTFEFLIPISFRID